MKNNYQQFMNLIIHTMKFNVLHNSLIVNKKSRLKV